MAERMGFEPTIQLLTVYSLSRRAPSTTRPPLRCAGHSRRAAAEQANPQPPAESLFRGWARRARWRAPRCGVPRHGWAEWPEFDSDPTGIWRSLESRRESRIKSMETIEFASRVAMGRLTSRQEPPSAFPAKCQICNRSLKMLSGPSHPAISLLRAVRGWIMFPTTDRGTPAFRVGLAITLGWIREPSQLSRGLGQTS